MENLNPDFLDFITLLEKSPLSISSLEATRSAFMDFLKPSFIIEIGRAPRKIQVLPGIDGVTFDECRKTAVESDYLGQKMRFIGLEELLRNKQASGRSKDLIDAQELLRGKS